MLVHLSYNLSRILIGICFVFKILDQVRYRVEWLKFQERERKKEEDALERERSKLTTGHFCIYIICTYIRDSCDLTSSQTNIELLIDP